MSKRIIKLNVSYIYELEIDDENSIVQEYETDSDIIDDLASYKFSSTLPVLKEGVKIKNFEIVGWDF